MNLVRFENDKMYNKKTAFCSFERRYPGFFFLNSKSARSSYFRVKEISLPLWMELKRATDFEFQTEGMVQTIEIVLFFKSLISNIRSDFWSGPSSALKCKFQTQMGKTDSFKISNWLPVFWYKVTAFGTEIFFQQILWEHKENLLFFYGSLKNRYWWIVDSITRF